jgi:hypothetical protein
MQRGQSASRVIFRPLDVYGFDYFRLKTNDLPFRRSAAPAMTSEKAGGPSLYKKPSQDESLY